MARKKKVETFSVVKAVKAAAREQIGKVPATKAVPDAKKRANPLSEKHKKSLAQMLEVE